MALVKDPLGGSAASGKMSGKVFARNRAGNYVRAWAKPVNPSSIRQTEVRAAFGFSSASWGGLVQSEVDAWDAYAATLTRLNRLGEPYTPKGRQIYMETSQNLSVAGIASLAMPSAFTDNPAIDGIGSFIATSTADILDGLDTTNIAFLTPSGGDGTVIFEATPPHDPKLTNVNNLYRQVFVAGGASPIAASDLLAGYIAVFGDAAVAGSIIDLRIRVVDNDSGLGSSYLKTQTVVT